MKLWFRSMSMLLSLPGKTFAGYVISPPSEDLPNGQSGIGRLPFSVSRRLDIIYRNYITGQRGPNTTACVRSAYNLDYVNRLIMMICGGCTHDSATSRRLATLNSLPESPASRLVRELTTSGEGLVHSHFDLP